MEPASAFPEPQGRMPTGIFIACSQSGRSISPLITYRNTKHSENHISGHSLSCNIPPNILLNFTRLSRPSKALQTSCKRPSPEIMMMPSHSGSDISRISSLAWFWRSVTDNKKSNTCYIYTSYVNVIDYFPLKVAFGLGVLPVCIRL